MTESLKIMLWGMEVGRLLWDRRRKRSYFTFNRDFLKRKLEIAPLVAPSDGLWDRLPLYSEENPIYQKLPAFIADSLPDSWGNTLFERWRTEKRLPLSDITPLDKLSFIGKRGMGALEFEPDTSPFTSTDTIEIEELTELAQRIFAQRESAKILPGDSLTLQSLVSVGTSAGGRQPKAVIAINRTTGEIRSGQIAGIEGYDYCIVKFGDAIRSTAEIEMTYYEMARLAGVNMMESEILEIEHTKHFLTKRFDRKGDEKLHTQTLAAMNPDGDSYEKLLWTCRKIHLPEKECEEVFRRMVFNIVANNTDDHNKNISFTMDRDGNWHLAPAYDVTFIFNTGGFQPEESHCLMMRGKLSNITKEDILEFARENGIKKANATIERILEAVSHFKEIALKHGVADPWIRIIDSTLQNRLFQKERGNR